MGGCGGTRVTGWARLLRGQRNIGDFTRWKEHDSYSKALKRLLRDLKVAAADQAS